ncbi:hypothetical protein SAMN05444274_109107 [Mariniphaga anaerophila]|uniref:Uncharacterized protein n=1 Tax=Mariniphaga anaerophila TaxID=1484053 RepID=A0A1M5ENJ6_9BACT|nr:hypothetical protein [Mariniphaga anaerophila]SHF80756.1 hypothetical protein SAMN05444274_109107 [Mariniphaga anaerophila]
MRNRSFRIFILVCIVVSVIGLPGFAQDDNFDKVVMLNGDEHIGKVTEMNPDDIGFVHKNETLTYKIAKADINKIQFSSGRIEVINAVADVQQTNMPVSLQSHHNWVAVLPFSYIGEGGGRDKKLEEKVQMDCYNVLRDFATQFEIQNPVTTNALLVKNGIDEQVLKGLTPEEIAHLLEVEYVVLGNITVFHTGTTTRHSSVSKQKTEKDSKKLVDILTDSGSTSTTDRFRTQVDMQIFNDLGQDIFTKSHDSFWQTEDAYEITLKYLIKRSPLYRK